MCGCHTSVADYAQELTEDTGTIPSHLEMYIDYERMGRDMELSGLLALAAHASLILSLVEPNWAPKAALVCYKG